MTSQVKSILYNFKKLYSGERKTDSYYTYVHEKSRKDLKGYKF